MAGMAPSGGDDEVKYNVNAPVSVDGGTGIDKLAILGTEFPDDFVITADNIWGAGLNVRYDAIEIVEISTTGDRVRDRALSAIGARGVILSDSMKWCSASFSLAP